ncbi:MAG TPA: hypothetical protein VMD30_10610, partial [Tepidisphaeraceae bacterium]|nr:hypothetical protein [Tepidisphaeraceae bacterium]
PAVVSTSTEYQSAAASAQAAADQDTTLQNPDAQSVQLLGLANSTQGYLQNASATDPSPQTPPPPDAYAFVAVVESPKPPSAPHPKRRSHVRPQPSAKVQQPLPTTRPSHKKSDLKNAQDGPQNPQGLREAMKSPSGAKAKFRVAANPPAGKQVSISDNLSRIGRLFTAMLVLWSNPSGRWSRGRRRRARRPHNC